MRPAKHILIAAIVVLIFGPLALADLSTGLIAYYPLDGNPDDASGSGNHGLAYGGVGYAQGVKNSAAVFDGIDDFITIPNNSIGNLGPSASIAFWFNPAAGNLDGNQYRILEKDDKAYWIFGIGSNKLKAHLRESNTYGSPEHSVDIMDPVEQSDWISVVMVKDGAYFDYYVDGDPAFSGTTTIDDVTTNAQMNFGYSEYWNDLHYEGMIDEVRVYDRVLNPAEIAELSIPEPVTLLLLGLGGLALLRKRSA